NVEGKKVSVPNPFRCRASFSLHSFPGMDGWKSPLFVVFYFFSFLFVYLLWRSQRRGS
ncbi:hypothetical protein COCCADRAFT_102208, partial [Bipolaris zeicola 26-R-13]